MKKVVRKVKLPVIIFKQGGMYVVYSPAIDLSSCGKKLSEAKQNFAEAVEIFFGELEEMGTLEEVLLDLGWEKKGRWNKMYPPSIVESGAKEFNVQCPI